MLSAVTAERLRQAPFSYEPAGCTVGSPPAGLRELRRTRTLAPGTDFVHAAGALMSWQVQARAGLGVAASSLTVEPGAAVELRVRVGPLWFVAPCRVAYVVDEINRQGFAYGTLPGHPESGEESFVIERRSDGRIDFTIIAYSRPATILAKLGGPITASIQGRITSRYLRSLDR